MAAEGAALSGSRAAGMVGSLWVLALVSSSVLALEGKQGGETEEVPPASRDPAHVGSRKDSEKSETSREEKGWGKFQRRAPKRQSGSCWSVK